MVYRSQIPAGRLLYLKSQKRMYQQEARLVLNQIKRLVRGYDGPERIDLRIDSPLEVVVRMIRRARSHYNLQAQLLGSSSHDELCARLSASAIGLDVTPDLTCDEVMIRIERLARALDDCKGGVIPPAPWAQVAIIAALRAISSAVA